MGCSGHPEERSLPWHLPLCLLRGAQAATRFSRAVSLAGVPRGEVQAGLRKEGLEWAREDRLPLLPGLAVPSWAKNTGRGGVLLLLTAGRAHRRSGVGQLAGEEETALCRVASPSGSDLSLQGNGSQT